MIKKEKGKKVYRVTEIEDLFFYTLYKFKAYWKAGEIHSKVSRRIKQMYGVNVDKYIVELHSDHLIHIFYRHFHDKDVRQKNISVNDVKNILNLINYCDTVEMTDLDHLKFKKRFPNGFYTFIVEIDNKNKKLLGTTFWISA